VGGDQQVVALSGESPNGRPGDPAAWIALSQACQVLADQENALHQLPTLETEAYNAILDIAKAIECLHFEQTGWQMHPGLCCKSILSI